MEVDVSETRANDKIAACKLWYWSTAALDEVVRARVDAEGDARGLADAASSSSRFVRRALGAYLAHVAGGGRVEHEPTRDPEDKRTSATIKCYAHVPHALRAVLTTYLRTLPPREGAAWPHSSRKSGVVRAAIRWWIRRNPA